MHTVEWIIEVNEGTSKKDILRGLEATAPDYKGVPGLIRTHLGLAANGKSVVEMSLWQSKAAADKFFDPAWETEASRRWMSAPMRRHDWATTIVVENP
jgi:hypothetical protein